MTYETELLSQLVDRKHECLRQLRDLGNRQLEMVRAGTIAELLDLLSAKQRVLAQLQKIERELDPFRNQDADRRQWRSEDDRQTCGRRLDECESLLKEITSLEEQSHQELASRRDETATQLQEMNQAIQARGAYVDSMPPGLGQLDLSSEG